VCLFFSSGQYTQNQNCMVKTGFLVTEDSCYTYVKNHLTYILSRICVNRPNLWPPKKSIMPCIIIIRRGQYWVTRILYNVLQEYLNCRVCGMLKRWGYDYEFWVCTTLKGHCHGIFHDTKQDRKVWNIVLVTKWQFWAESIMNSRLKYYFYNDVLCRDAGTLLSPGTVTNRKMTTQSILMRVFCLWCAKKFNITSMACE
jgi:hypothetical protein